MPSPDRAALARERLASRARHVTIIRRRVVAATLAAFVLAWGAIVYDGSMGTATTTASTKVAAATASPTATPTSSADSPSTLTTSQS